MSGDVDKVPYILGELNHHGDQRFEDASRYGEQIVSQFSDRFDRALNGLDEVAGTLQGLVTSAPTPSGAPGPPDIPAPPSSDLGINPPDPPPAPTQGAFVPPAYVALERPTFNDPDVVDPGTIQPNFPAFPDVDTSYSPIELPEIPAFSSDVTLTNPPPVSEVTPPPAPAVTDVSLDLPKAPDLTAYLRNVPDVPSFNAPENPGFDVQQFNPGDVPVIPIPPAFNPANFVLKEFMSRVKPCLEDAVIDMVQRAQLDAEYEQASFDAVMAREVEASHAAMGKLPEVWASAGFMLPPGAMFQQDMEIRREIERKAKAGSREIYVRRKEQELAVRQAALQAGTSLASIDAQLYQVANATLLEYHKFVQEQALKSYEYALQAARIGVEQFRVKADSYRAYLDGLRAKWDGYRAAVQGEAAKFDAIRAQIGAVSALAGLGQAQAQAYSAVVEAQTALAKLYADRDRLQFDLWKAQVDVQVEKLRAHSTYGDIIRAQAAAIDARARAYQANVQALIERTKLQGTVAGLQMESAKVKVSLYDAAVRAEAERVKALTEIVRTRASIYTEMVRYQAEKSRAYAASVQAEAQINTALQSSAASAYSAVANANSAHANAYAALANAHASLANVKRVQAEAKAAEYRARVEALITAYRAQVEAADRTYMRALSVWSESVDRAYRGVDALVTKYATAAGHASSVAAAALNGTFVSMQVHDSISTQYAHDWSYRLVNQLEEIYQAQFK